MQMTDAVSRLMMLTAPKAGATVLAQVTLDLFNLTAEATRRNMNIHAYRELVFDKAESHRKLSVCTTCAPDSGWTCIMFARSPADRAVSSYIHVMRTKLKRQLPGFEDFAGDLTFRDYVDVLLELRTRPQIHFAEGHHAAPQAVTYCPSPIALVTVGVEFLDAGLEAAGAYIGISFPDTTNYTSAHHVSKHARLAQALMDNKNASGASAVDVPFSQLLPDPHNTTLLPPYEAFLQDDDINAALFCCLFDDDIAMYEQSCNQPWLVDACPLCVARCWKEVARLRALATCS